MRKAPSPEGGGLRFKKEHWLTKEQIQSYFSRLHATQKKAEQGKAKKTPPPPTKDEIFDAERDLTYEEEMHFRHEVEFRAENDTSEQHPIQVNGIDVCELENSISTTEILTRSKLYDHNLDKLKTIIAAIQKEFPGKRASMQKAAKIITSYVKDSHQKMDESGEICPHYKPQITITE